jgi:ribose transport system substrate-binding protein
MLKTSRRARPLMAGTAFIAVAAVLAACGSTKSASTGGSTTPGSGSTASSSSTGVASTSGVLASYENAPTAIPIATPLKATPPRGKTFVFLQCDVAQCTEESTAMKAVVAAVGWNLKVIPYQSENPATLISGLQQALQLHPAAVGLTGIPQIEWQSELPAYQKAGIPIIVGQVGPQVLSKTVIASIGNVLNVQITAKVLADYFIAKSGGKGKILQFQVPDFPILGAFDEAFRTDVQASCPGCSVTQLTGTIAEVTSGGSTAAIVSALQRNSQDTWLVTDDGPWVDGLPSALAAAHLHVKIIGEGADVTDETDIKQGTMTAFTAVALDYGMWAMMDAALRHLEGMPNSPNEGLLPFQLLVQGESFTVSESYNQPSDFAAQMEKLWHVGS